MALLIGLPLKPTAYDDDRPWNRQPCDVEVRWRGFKAYRDQVPPRTVRAASEAVGRSYELLRVWAKQDAWRERCMAYDRFLDETRVTVITDVLSEDARVVANRHASIARDAIECAHSVVRGWIEKIAVGERLEGWTPNEVRSMLRDMITLERLVRGEATERVEVGVVDLGKLSIDELEQLRALEGKAGVVR